MTWVFARWESCATTTVELEKCGYPRLGGTHQMVEVIRQYGVTQVIRTEMPATADEQHFFVEACDQLGVRLLVVANLPERWGRPLTFIDDDGVRFIGLREEALENRSTRSSSERSICWCRCRSSFSFYR